MRVLLSPETRWHIFRRDDFRCAYCGKSALTDDIALEVDHVIPISNGGTDDPENLTASCPPCNRSKRTGSKPASSWRTQHTLYFDRDVLAWLEEQAREPRVTVSGLVREILRTALEDEAALESVS